MSRYPEKIVSLNLSKKMNYEGNLVGVKGQYLIFEDNTVFNVRGNEGSIARLEVMPSGQTLSLFDS